jgi:hypothetical protein
MTINTFNKNLLALNLRNEAMTALAQTEDSLLSNQTSQLVVDGLNKNGRNLKKYKNAKYAEKKHRMNSFPGLGNPDLKYTGAFLKALKLDIINNKEYQIISTDVKYPILLQKYGSAMLGLNKASIKRYKEKAFQKQLVDNVKAKLFK